MPPGEGRRTYTTDAHLDMQRELATRTRVFLSFPSSLARAQRRRRIIVVRIRVLCVCDFTRPAAGVS